MRINTTKKFEKTFLWFIHYFYQFQRFFRLLFSCEVTSQIDVIDGAAVATSKVKCVIHSIDGNYKKWQELAAKVNILITFVPI